MLTTLLAGLARVVGAIRSATTTLLDIVGVVLLAAAAWFVWEPLPLVVVGLACLVASAQASRGKP